ncbi:hypothetical protein ElyMa_005223200 [Elysia marginata]|uniref:Uncharacterized protein n=1 Tax=Elysia marginata TaxID=1093978 RepID=A0AAV4JVH0_9GAST|nr:hypothetical protein ElyMa_005223200 [Elysia marginata]
MSCVAPQDLSIPVRVSTIARSCVTTETEIKSMVSVPVTLTQSRHVPQTWVGRFLLARREGEVLTDVDNSTHILKCLRRHVRDKPEDYNSETDQHQQQQHQMQRAGQ